MNIKIIILSFVLASIYFSCATIKPVRPKITAEQTKDTVRESVINLPIRIENGSIEQILNDKIPDTLFSRNGINAGNGITIHIKVIRNGRISTSISNNKLILEIPLQINGGFNWNESTGKNVKSILSILNTIENHHQDFQSKFTLHTAIQLNMDEKWNIISLANSDFSMENKPEPEILGIKIPSNAILSDQIRKFLPEINHLMGDNLNDLFHIRQRLEQYWQAMNKPLLITEKPVKIWALFKPAYFHISPVKSINNEELEIIIAFHSVILTYVGENPPSPANGNLVSLKKEEIPQTDFSINLPMIIELSELKRVATTALAGKSFSITGTTRKVLITSFDMYGIGNQLILNIGIKSRRIKGNIYLVSKPVFDPVTEIFSIQNIDFDVSTNNLLLNKASWLINKLFLSTIQQKLVYHAANVLDKAKQETVNALNKLNIVNEIRVDTRINDLNINSLSIDSDYIKINSNIHGTLAVTLNNIK